LEYTQAELDEIAANRVYWERLAELLNWRLRSFHLRASADYFTKQPGYTVCRLQACERDRIVEAIEGRTS
jgi:hypothetical protein